MIYIKNGKLINYGNRGMTLEEDINQTNEYIDQYVLDSLIDRGHRRRYCNRREQQCPDQGAAGNAVCHADAERITAKQKKTNCQYRQGNDIHEFSRNKAAIPVKNINP